MARLAGGRTTTNTVAQLVGPLYRAVIVVLVAAITARHLGVAGFGQYALVVAYVVLFTGAIPELGVARIVVREISRSPERRAELIASAALLKLVVAAVAYAILLAIALASDRETEVGPALAVLGLTVFIAPVQMLGIHFEVDLRLSRLVAPAIAGTTSQLLLVVAAVSLGGGLLAIAAAGAIAVWIEHAWVALLVLREMVPRPVTRSPWGMFVREAWPLSLTAVVAAAARQAPFAALAPLGADALGLYGAGERIATFVQRIPVAFRTTAFPALAATWPGPDFAAVVRRTLLLTMLAGGAGAAAGVVLATPLMAALYGRGFSDAALPFALLMLASVPIGAGVVIDGALVAMGLTRTSLVVRLVGAATLLVALALASAAGAPGAAAAVLVSATVAGLIAAAILARRVLGARA